MFDFFLLLFVFLWFVASLFELGVVYVDLDPVVLSSGVGLIFLKEIW